MYDKRLEPVLLDVQKPGRYVGGELNSVVKNKEEVDVRFAFCFPDTYEIGMSHLGLKILYGVINEQPGMWCERVFAPWGDMEDQMRRLDVPLYALESGDPLDEFDFIGFTLQYELSYTNILNMLELGRIPLKASERKGLKHIVIGGGPCACNPEPLAEFFDLFCLGDGEEVDVQVMQLWRECRDAGKSREEFMTLWGMKNTYPADKLLDAARSFSLVWCRHAVRRCSETELILKSSYGQDQEVLVSLLMELAAGRRAVR